ncbi:MAG: response regulator [Rhodospirillales bacterium]
MAESRSMKVLLADDHSLFREGLRRVLADFDPGIEVIEAADYADALTAADEQNGLGLALVDLTMPGMERFTGLAALGDRLGDVPVVVVSAAESGDEVRRAMACGASSYITKALDSEVIRAALERVLAGDSYLPPSMVGWEDDEPLRPVPPPPRLTPRQRDVLGLIAQGYSNKRIASELNLAEGTVKLHVAALLRALGADNRTEAVFEATALGLVASPTPDDSRSRA